MIEAEHPEICEADKNEKEFVERCREYQLQYFREKSALNDPVKTTQAERGD